MEAEPVLKKLDEVVDRLKACAQRFPNWEHERLLSLFQHVRRRPLSPTRWADATEALMSVVCAMLQAINDHTPSSTPSSTSESTPEREMAKIETLMERLCVSVERIGSMVVPHPLVARPYPIGMPHQ